MGEYLRRDHLQSIDSVVRMFCADDQWRAWGELDHSVRTGENAARHALGIDVWEYRRRHSEDGLVFDAAMQTMADSYREAILGAHDFRTYRVIADIGGGTGTLLAAILGAHPETRGILAEQPHVLNSATPVLAAAGVADRVATIECDFFAHVPHGADAYLLLRVLHDWIDEDAVKILRRVREAADPTLGY